MLACVRVVPHDLVKDKIVRLEQVNKELNLNEKEHEIIENDEPDEKSQERDFDKER